MKWLYAMLAGLFLATAAHADDLAPDALVKNVSEEVLDIVRKDKDIQSGNTKKAVELVEKKVLPHFNFEHMTRLAMGIEWRQAAPEQQKALIEEFRTLLVRTYSKALTEYKNQTIDYKPLKGPVAAGEPVKVHTNIKQAGGKPIELDYYLEKKDTGWKVFDIEVGGVSLVTNYRSSFATEIRNGGVDGLIKSLQAKNKAGETAAKK
jgi:phospholipid transport system substrate-binding protein